jgi:hypothetical protein
MVGCFPKVLGPTNYKFCIKEWERAWWPQNRDRVEAGSRWLRHQSVAAL